MEGALRQYDLLYAWSSERDILLDTAVALGRELYAYRLNVDAGAARAILQRFLERTEALARGPRFCNTFLLNCTNELAKAVNQSFPGSPPLPWHHSFVLTGFAAEHLHRLGYIGDEQTPFANINAAARIDQKIVAAQWEPEELFSEAIRAGR